MSDGPIYWHPGLFLQPQHFQILQRQVAEALTPVTASVTPFFWGVASLTIGEGALAAGRLELTGLRIVFPSAAEMIAFPGNAVCAGRQLPLDAIPADGAATAYLGIRAVKPGLVQGSVREREYLPFELFNPQVEATPVYAVHHRLSPMDGKAELHISVAYPGGSTEPNAETLSMEVLCTNGNLPETLRPGDVRLPTESSPELAEFSNIRTPTAPVQPPLGKNLLWRLLSHLFLNYLSVATAENLRSVLKLYIFTETRDRAAVLANTQRVEAIRGLDVRAADRFVKGHLLRGQEIHAQIDPQGFAGQGDLYLFGSILDVFLGNYAAINAYTRLTVEDTLRKERLTWPIRLGDRVLL